MASDHATKPGWPRPQAPYRPIHGRSVGYKENPRKRRLPVPWVIGVDPEQDEPAWTEFHFDAIKAHIERLCQVCGEELGASFLLGRAPSDEPAPKTSGPGCHPRCMAMTLSFCPHFRHFSDTDTVAYLYEGEDVGYQHDPDKLAEYENNGIALYSDALTIDPSARALTRTEVICLARVDALGQAPHPDLGIAQCLLAVSD